MTCTGQADNWTEGSLNARTGISMSTRTKIPMDNDLQAKQKLGRDRDEHQDGDLDGL